MAINFNGLVSVCCIDWSYKTIIGNVVNKSLLEIWNNSRIYEFKKMHAEMRRNENPACKNCEYFRDLEEKSYFDEIAKHNIDKLFLKPNI